jgi:glycosyltransferase involved in cell wall biosynthesis
MRIVLFSEVFLPKVDGIVNTLCRLLEYFQRKGDTCLVVAPQGSVQSYAGCQVIQVPAFRLPFYPEIKLANPLISLNQQLDRFRPDVVHIANPFSIGLIGMRYAHSRGIPIAASYHTDIPGFAARWGWGAFSGGLQTYMRWLHNQADINLCPSNATRNYLAHQGYERLQIWTRGVDTERFSPKAASMQMRYRLSANHPSARLLLYVGRLSAEKRVEWLKPVLEAASDAQLAIVGDGPQRSRLEEIFRGLPVKFMGFLRGDELASAYASADIFTFPSANETFGNVALEAMASGLPVIAPRSGGLLDFMEHGKNGLLFDQENMGSLVENTLLLVKDPGYAHQIGCAGMNTASQRSWNTVLDSLSLQYADLIDLGYSRHLNKHRVRPVRKIGWNEGL